MGEKEKKPVLHTSDISSLLDLKTEFLERKKAAEGAAKSYSEKYVNPTRSRNVLAMTKEEKKVKEQVGKERQQRIQLSAEAIRKEEAERQKRQRILEQKAKVYDRMVAGESLTYDDGTSVEFLVNFAHKKKELEEMGVVVEPPPTEDPKDAEAASSVFLRARDEETPLIVHYDPSEEPGRMFGAAHIPLPIHDEEQRQKTIDELKWMTEETTKNRKKRKRDLDPKAQADRERLNKLRVQKGLPPLESSDSDSDSDDDEEDEGGGEGGIDINSIPLPPGMAGPSTSTEEETQKRGAAGEERPNEFKPTREWDRGKFGYKHWIEGQREVRNEEFAPPSFYYTDAGSNKKRRRKQPQ